MAFPIAPLAATLMGGLMGGGEPEAAYAPQQEWAMRFLKKIAKGYLQDSKSVPGSLPQEQMALAQAKGLAGEQYRDSFQNLLAMLGTNNPAADNAGDALTRFEEGRVGNLMNMDQQALFQSLLQRQGFRDRAAGVAGQVGGIAGNPAGGLQGGAMDLTGLFQAIGQQLGQRRRSGAFTPPISGVSMGSIGGAAGGAMNFQPGDPDYDFFRSGGLY